MAERAPKSAPDDAQEIIPDPSQMNLLDGVHLPRDWQSRAANPVRQPRQTMWQETGLLSRIRLAAREGMDQMWIRTKAVDGQPDPANIAQAMQAGWMPRSAASAPEGAYLPVVQDATFGGIIAYHDTVLMERPSHFGDEERAMVRERTARATAAISADPYRADSMGRVVRQEYSQERITRTGPGAGRIAQVDP
jgi:hypothetical protein